MASWMQSLLLSEPSSLELYTESAENDSENSLEQVSCYYATEENLHDCVLQLQSSLKGLGLPWSFALPAISTHEKSTICNCLYSLLNCIEQHTRDNTKTQDAFRMSQSKLQAANNTISMLELRVVDSENQIRACALKQQQIEATNLVEVRKITQQRDEALKKCSQLQHKVQHLEHKLRQQETDYVKLQEHLRSYLAKERKDAKSVVDVQSIGSSNPGNNQKYTGALKRNAKTKRNVQEDGDGVAFVKLNYRNDSEYHVSSALNAKKQHDDLCLVGDRELARNLSFLPVSQSSIEEGMLSASSLHHNRNQIGSLSAWQEPAFSDVNVQAFVQTEVLALQERASQILADHNGTDALSGDQLVEELASCRKIVEDQAKAIDILLLALKTAEASIAASESTNQRSQADLAECHLRLAQVQGDLRNSRAELSRQEGLKKEDANNRWKLMEALKLKEAAISHHEGQLLSLRENVALLSLQKDEALREAMRLKADLGSYLPAASENQLEAVQAELEIEKTQRQHLQLKIRQLESQLASQPRAYAGSSGAGHARQWSPVCASPQPPGSDCEYMLQPYSDAPWKENSTWTGGPSSTVFDQNGEQLVLRLADLRFPNMNLVGDAVMHLQDETNGACGQVYEDPQLPPVQQQQGTPVPVQRQRWLVDHVQYRSPLHILRAGQDRAATSPSQLSDAGQSESAASLQSYGSFAGTMLSQHGSLP